MSGVALNPKDYLVDGDGADLLAKALRDFIRRCRSNEMKISVD